jgi:hypothetical protein
MNAEDYEEMAANFKVIPTFRVATPKQDVENTVQELITLALCANRTECPLPFDLMHHIMRQRVMLDVSTTIQLPAPTCTNITINCDYFPPRYVYSKSSTYKTLSLIANRGCVLPIMLIDKIADYSAYDEMLTNRKKSHAINCDVCKRYVQRTQMHYSFIDHLYTMSFNKLVKYVCRTNTKILKVYRTFKYNIYEDALDEEEAEILADQFVEENKNVERDELIMRYNTELYMWGKGTGNLPVDTYQE